MHSRLFDKLFKAAAEGDAAGIVRLRARCRSVLIQDDDDNTPLHLAARGGHTAAVYELLKRDGSVAAKVCNLAEETPFTLAVQYGRPEIARMLLHAADFDVNRQDSLGRTALHLAVEHGASSDMIHLLLAAYADIRIKDHQKRTPVSLAHQQGKTEAVEQMRRENPALRQAARRGNLPEIRRLLAEGADIHARDLAGYSALANALDCEEHEAANLLIEAGARLSLNEMVRLGDVRDVEVLLDCGADANEQTLDYQTPLLRAIDEQNPAMVRLLLAAGADVNLSTMAGTPLQEAAWRESSDIVQMLIEAGANVNTRSYHGSTALLETIILQRTKNLALLIRAGVDVNQRGAEGFTPLAKAKLFERDDIIRPLLAAGADPGSEVSP